MYIAEKIKKKINGMKDGTTFRYQQLGITPHEYPAAAKAIERLIRQGIIKRATTGVFYKPKQSPFGELQPREEELLKPYLFEDNKRIAYVTGLGLFNRLGLTTQVPKTIKVASKSKRVTARIGQVAVKPVTSYVEVNNENYRLLELLDALKDFKTIPDLDKKSAITILRNKIKALEVNDLARLIRYSYKYPPRTRAFLGAILAETKKSENEMTLRESLNPLTSYKLGINSQMLPSATKWNIE
jgi:hypothetical protein